MKSVAIVSPRYPPVSTGGGEQSAKLLATGLANTKYIDKVKVYAFDDTDYTDKGNISIRRLGKLSSLFTEYQNLMATWKLQQNLDNPDIIHAYNMELHPAVGYLSSITSTPSVATLNSYHFFPNSVTNTSANGLEWIYEKIGMPTTGRLLRHYMKHIDTFVALSDAIEKIYRTNGFENATIEQIPNMVDPNFSVARKRKDMTDDTSVKLLYVGSLTENKGVKYLVKALDRLPEKYRLQIVGEGNKGRQLQKLAESLDLTDRITFSGWIPYEKVSKSYSTADIFVHPGIWPEPLNRTVLEAMQAALPVVCTDIGGPPEVIQNDELLCPPENPTALAETIQRAATLEQDIGASNKAYVEENHMPSVVIPQIVALYKELLLC